MTENLQSTTDDAASEPSTGLGTFGGVFTPSILTILGVIMYLRFGWVVGSVGLWKTFAIVTIATSITFITGLSISAIATAQHVKVGGAYYMISRSLGIETGGAVGISLYFAQALSVALYTIGFAESVVRVFPALNEKFVGLVTTSLVAIVALKSARAAIRAQYVIMAAIGVSLLSLMFGSPIASAEAIAAAEPAGEGFWIVFAVFFPAVTGIMAGVNMSGDLADSARSIPRGTLAAIGAGFVIYMAIPLFLVGRATPEQLVSDPLVMKRIAFWGDAILLGVWGATLSSAVGSILGAPRVLQALARDNVLPRSLSFLGRGTPIDDEPRIGTAVTFAIAIVTVYLGNLNAIAPVLSMFFLTTYGILNIAAGVERFLGNPSFRPAFKVHWAISVVGAFGCVAVMFLINAVATTVSVIVVVLMYFLLERKEVSTSWGDVRSGIWSRLASAGIFRLGADPDPKNWRPHLLVFSGAPTRRWHLIDLARSLTHNRALMTVATVLPADVAVDRLSSMEHATRDYLKRRGVQSLVRIVPSDDAFTGARMLVSAYGLGALVPNTIVFGDAEAEASIRPFCETIAYLHEARRNVVVVKNNDERGFGRKKTIDVWWGGLKGNGSLMIILSYMLSSSLEWRGATVRLKMVVPSEAAAETAQDNLDAIVTQMRTGAEPHLQIAGTRSFQEILHESSSDADLVIVGVAEPGPTFVDYWRNVQQRLEGLPTTLLVLASEDLAFGDILQDD
jgi:amino acid transporter